MARRRHNQADRKREVLRDNLWPGSGQWIWDPSDVETIGFATVPRLLPLILHLLKELSGGRAGDPSSVYLELWCRDFGQGIITVSDEQEFAFAAGYDGNRAVRTWRERMYALVEQGFILVKQEGNREFGQVLLLNPISVCTWLRAENKVSDAWWTAFVRRANDIGAKIPKTPALPGKPAAPVAPA
jgi:hypothetical protein